jgi:hypothetical protein
MIVLLRIRGGKKLTTDTNSVRRDKPACLAIWYLISESGIERREV